MKNHLFVALLFISVERSLGGRFPFPFDPKIVYTFAPADKQKSQLEVTKTNVFEEDEDDAIGHRDAFIIPQGEDLNRFLDSIRKAHDYSPLKEKDFFDEDETSSESDSDEDSSELETVSLGTSNKSMDSTEGIDHIRDSSLWKRMRPSNGFIESLIFSPPPDKPEALTEAPPVQIRKESPDLFVKIVSGLGFDGANRNNLMIEPMLDFVYYCAKNDFDLPELPLRYEGEHWEFDKDGQEHLLSGVFEVRGAERVRALGTLYTQILKDYKKEWEFWSQKLDTLVDAAQKHKAQCESRLLSKYAKADYEKYENLAQQAKHAAGELERLRGPIAKLQEIVNGPFLPSQFQKAVYNQFTAQH